jgi:hypothetical protein
MSPYAGVLIRWIVPNRRIYDANCWITPQLHGAEQLNFLPAHPAALDDRSEVLVALKLAPHGPGRSAQPWTVVG